MCEGHPMPCEEKYAQEEAHGEVIDNEIHETLDADVGINENNGILFYLLDDDGVVHDDYWSSFGLPIYH
jgi:PAB1-binding protein PBP1